MTRYQTHKQTHSQIVLQILLTELDHIQAIIGRYDTFFFLVSVQKLVESDESVVIQEG